MLAFWGPVLGALVAGIAAYWMWNKREERDARRETIHALYAFQYFGATLADVLTLPSSEMSFLKLDLLNGHIARLIEMDDARVALFEVQTRYIRWASGVYEKLGSGSPEVAREQLVLRQHAQNASERLMELRRTWGSTLR